MSDIIEPDKLTIDATGHRCPMPVLFLQRALGKMTSGDICELLTTDPASLRDVPRFCREEGHGCDLMEGEATPYRFRVTKDT